MRYILVGGSDTTEITGQRFLDICKMMSSVEELNKMIHSKEEMVKLGKSVIIGDLYNNSIKELHDGYHRDLSYLIMEKKTDANKCKNITRSFKTLTYNQGYKFNDKSIKDFNDFFEKHFYLLISQFEPSNDKMTEHITVDELFNQIEKNLYDELNLVSTVNNYLGSIHRNIEMMEKHMDKNLYDYQLEDLINIIILSLHNKYSSKDNLLLFRFKKISLLKDLFKDRHTTIKQFQNKLFNDWWNEEKEYKLGVAKVEEIENQSIEEYRNLPFTEIQIKNVNTYEKLKEFYLKINYIIQKRILQRDIYKFDENLIKIVNQALPPNTKINIVNQYQELEKKYESQTFYTVYQSINTSVSILYNNKTRKIHKRFANQDDLMKEKNRHDELQSRLNTLGINYVLFYENTEPKSNDLIMPHLPNYLRLNHLVSLPCMLSVVTQLLIASAHFENANYCHTDFKPENILVTRDGQHIKFIDITGVFSGSKNTDIEITFPYADSHLDIKTPDPRIHLYSIAVIMFEYLQNKGRLDANFILDNQIIDEFLPKYRSRFRWLNDAVMMFSDSLKLLLKDLIKPIENRLSAAQILEKYPFLYNHFTKTNFIINSDNVLDITMDQLSCQGHRCVPRELIN